MSVAWLQDQSEMEQGTSCFVGLLPNLAVPYAGGKKIELLR